MASEDVLKEHQIKIGTVLQIARGDITQERVDAIVNAANAHLQHGGGVAGVISRRGGAQIQIESDVWVKQHGPVTHERPAYTSGGRLPCRYVIHAVGPVWGSGDEDAMLGEAVLVSLDLAEGLNLESIAIPAISTGIFGFPKERAAGVIMDAVIKFFAVNPSSGLRLVRLTLYDDATVSAFLKAWQAKFPGGK